MEDSCYVGRIGKYVVLMVADGNGSTSGSVDSGVLVTTIASDWLSHAILNPDGSEKNVNLDMIGESLDSMTKMSMVLFCTSQQKLDRIRSKTWN